MGIVYKALQANPQRLVALKMILAAEWIDPKELLRFHTEAQAIARLEHPNVVRIHEVGDHDGYPYFVLEFMDGGNLAQKRGGQPMRPHEAARLTETLARAMQHVHERGVIHRDLKPANVLLASNGTPKISDFGLAKQFARANDYSQTISVPDWSAFVGRASRVVRMRQQAASHNILQVAETETGAVMGTPSYMAPEQALGMTRFIGPGTDIYALGTVLYQMLTGRPPFTGATLRQVLEQVCVRQPVPPTSFNSHVPTDLETICVKCLRKRPSGRYADAQTLADDLHRFLAGAPIEAQKETVAEPQIDPRALWDLALAGGAMTHDEWKAWACQPLGSPAALLATEQWLQVDEHLPAPGREASLNRRASIATIALVAAGGIFVGCTLLAGRLGATVGGAIWATVFCVALASEHFRRLKWFCGRLREGWALPLGRAWLRTFSSRIICSLPRYSGRWCRPRS
jgi:serine/threonine-protein kinase